MIKRPKSLDFDALMLIAEGHAAFQLLWAGTQLKVFDALAESPGSTLDEVATEIGIDLQPARVLLVGLASIGLVKVASGRFTLPELARRHLVTDAEESIIPILGWQHHIVYKGLIDFVDALRENRNVGLERFPGPGNTLYERLTGDVVLETVFQDAMSSLSRQANQRLIEMLDLSGLSHIMDVGGGDGTNAIALVENNPGLKATVFDSASVCGIATANISRRGLSDRIDTLVGNLFDTPYPAGLDAIIYCHMFTIYSPEKNRRILKKTADALPIGGKVIIFNMMGNDDDDGPISTALGSPYFQAIATGEGMLYSWRDYETWLRDAGFKGFERIENLPMDHGAFVATK
jgi:ubiquinone/menaquinone biosynthesis C-methylase UbiE